MKGAREGFVGGKVGVELVGAGEGFVGKELGGKVCELVDEDGLFEKGGDDLADGPGARLVGGEELGDVGLDDFEFLGGQDAGGGGDVEDVELVLGGQFILGEEVFLGNGGVSVVEAYFDVFCPPLHFDFSFQGLSGCQYLTVYGVVCVVV